MFANRRLNIYVSICSFCIEKAIDSKVKDIWYASDPEDPEVYPSCPYCKEDTSVATYACILIKQEISFAIKMHAACFEENIGIGL
jgi:hypothetical protein